MTDRRLRETVAVLSAIGAGVAAYLTITHLTNTPLSCVTGGCETVQHSRYSELGGVPIAALGLACYVALAASAASRTELARIGAAVLALAGFAFALYLVYVQAFVLDAYCQWCLTSDGVLALLVPATLLRLRG